MWRFPGGMGSDGACSGLHGFAAAASSGVMVPSPRTPSELAVEGSGHSSPPSSSSTAGGLLRKKTPQKYEAV